MQALRNLVAMLLLAVIALPFLLPALSLGETADASLPACCRRHGEHHCAMNMAERLALSATSTQARQWRAPAMHCPYCPAFVTSTGHHGAVGMPSSTAHAVRVFGHPKGAVQTESKRRLARERARQKRGPPVSFT